MRTRILVCLYLAVAVLPTAVKLFRLHDHGIFGALPGAPRPALSADGVRSEDYQKAFTAWFDSDLGWKGRSIMTDNAILLHAFHDTKPGSGVVLGERHVLFAIDDIGYYNRSVDQLPSPARIDTLADQIAALQAVLRAQHRALVPVIVASKTSVYRDAVPRAWTRALGEPRPSDAGVYHAIKHALDARGVVYVDAREILTAPGVQRDQVWGPEARHWSTYGSCLALREVMRAYTALTGDDQLPYECRPGPRWRPPDHDDFDLWNLLNAWRPPRIKKLRTWAEHEPPPDGTARPSVMFVGTSFCWNLMRDAGDSQRFAQNHMNYYDKTLVEWPANIHTDIHPYSPEWRALFLDRELYVLDLFEPYLAAPDTYADQFLAEVGGEIERAAGSAAPAGGHH
jgi:acetyltransferase AlgX (SGNH hydrolase-like protein)